MRINVLISNPDYISELLSYPEIECIYVEQERIKGSDRLRSLVRSAHGAGKKLFLALPYIWNSRSEKTLERELPLAAAENMDGYLIRNLDELGLLNDIDAPGRWTLDAGMYTWNRRAMKTFTDMGADRFTAPYELNCHELEDRGWERTELVVYGYYPMMISSNCLRLTTGKCLKDSDSYGVYRLKDRKNASFPAVNCCRYCYNIIYNSVPLWLLDEPGIAGAESLRLNFTVESRAEVRGILSRITEGNIQTGSRFTRGHYKRGAE